MADEKKGVGLAVLGGFALGAATVLLIVWFYQSQAAPPTAQTPGPGGIARTDPAPAPPASAVRPPGVQPPVATAPAPPGPDLLGRSLIVPVAGIEPGDLQDTFDDPRGGGGRVHEALDILAPRNTPVVAVEGGRIAKLFTSAQGGLTIYQFDPTETYCYYYAHLERYAPGLSEGDRVARGQVLGSVGTSGNAGPDNPHLHFAIFRLNEQKSWWQGTPVNPYPVLGGGAEDRAAR
jgi:murein DD-endopeptidase MepM/ murein hydrolase activator NlpD